MAQPHVLVLGCGSIGQRHLRAFAATERCRLSACDSRPEVLAPLAEELAVARYADWREALADRSITAVVIATPAPSHVPLAQEILSRGRHVLIEKPLALSLDGIEALVQTRDRAGRYAGIAYVQRFNPVVEAIRHFVRAGTWGPPLQAALAVGQHFPTFRPAYREIYYRDRAQGGGCINDALTHTLDGLGWILGPASRVYCEAEHQALEGVSVEDTVNLTARHGPTMVSIAHNQFQAPNEARWDFHFARGSVRAELRRYRWGTFAHGDTDWTWHDLPPPGRDGQFLAQANAFLDSCDGAPSPVACSLDEGIQTLRFTLAALRSAATGVPVSVNALGSPFVRS